MFLAGCGNQTNQPVNNQDQAGLANPASVYCREQGGSLQIKKNNMGGEYGICYFMDNRQCEEWALLRGFCPVGGIKVTGFNTDQEIYCAILGGQTFTGGQVCAFSNGAECNLNDLYDGNCQQYFNETDGDWQYKKVAGAEILVGYPAEQVELSTTASMSNNIVARLLVEAIKITDLPLKAPAYADQKSAQIEEASLAKGEFGTIRDWSATSSEKVIKIGDLFAKEYATFSRFEVCDVALERILRFYRNGYRVTIIFSGNKEKIMAENPDYFLQDKKSCGEELMWNFQADDYITAKFYQNLVDQKLTGAAAEWFNDFDLIKAAVVLQ